MSSGVGSGVIVGDGVGVGLGVGVGEGVGSGVGAGEGVTKTTVSSLASLSGTADGCAASGAIPVQAHSSNSPSKTESRLFKDKLLPHSIRRLRKRIGFWKHPHIAVPHDHRDREMCQRCQAP